MTGQGSPTSNSVSAFATSVSPERILRHTLPLLIVLGMLCPFASLVSGQSPSDRPDFNRPSEDREPTFAPQEGNAGASASQLPVHRLRLAWGGGQDVSWTGSLSIDRGKLSKPAPLGLDRNSVATARQTDPRTISLRQISPTQYDGFDFTCAADRSATIRISLSAIENPDLQWEQTIAVSELIARPLNLEIDEQQHWVSLARAPGDAAPIDTPHDHLIFRPGDVFSFSVAGNATSIKSSDAVCEVNVVAARQATHTITPAKVHWSRSTSTRFDAQGDCDPLTFNMEVPSKEGVYDAVITFHRKLLGGSIDSATRRAESILNAATPALVNGLAGGLRNNSLERRIQFVVLSEQPPTSANDDLGNRWETIGRISPEELLRPLSRWGVRPLSPKRTISGQAGSDLESFRARTWLRLNTQQWHAIEIPVQRPGAPHQVEIDFPRDVPVAMAVSILDFDEDGQVPIEGADSGIFVPVSVSQQITEASESTGPAPSPASNTATHRMTFWPRSSRAWLLIANQSPKLVARVGEVRVWAGPNHLPTSGPTNAAEPAVTDQRDTSASPARLRRRLAMLDSPSFAEQMNVAKFVDPGVGRPLDDWLVFYQGASRLIEELKAGGYQGAVINISSGGSRLYPSSVVSTNPASDTGTFQTLGQDPFRKDVVGLLIRMFDREGLQLVPAFALSGPDSMLEWEGSADNSRRASHQLTDYSGQSPPDDARDLPRYNPLDRTVQQRAVDQIEEFVQRYRSIRSFRSMGDVALMCRPDCWTMLPGHRWAFDTETLDQFFRSLPPAMQDELPVDFEQRIALLFDQLQPPWLQWRNDTMSSFYERLANRISETNPNARLLIAPLRMHENEELHSLLSPSLHASVDANNMMIRVGIDRDRLSATPAITVVAPQFLSPQKPLADNRVAINTNEHPGISQYFSTVSRHSATAFDQEGIWSHFSQLQQQPPFDRQSARLMRRHQLTPAGKWNRQRLAEAIFRQDSACLFDGGQCLMRGQGESLSNFMAVYSRLPEIRFEEVVQNNLPSELAHEGVSTAIQINAQRPTRPRQSDPRRNGSSVAVRTAEQNGRRYWYAVNQSPWPVNVTVTVSGAAPPDANSGETVGAFRSFSNIPISHQPSGPQSTLTFELPAFELYGGVFESESVTLDHFAITVAPEVRHVLRKRIYQLQAKLNLATSTEPIDVIANPEFEIDGRESLEGWDVGDQPAHTVGLENSDQNDSAFCLRMRSAGDPVWIRSNRFAPTQTGRISVTAWVRSASSGSNERISAAQSDAQPPLRISIEGQTRRATWYRFGSIGSLSEDQNINQVGPAWRKFAVHFDDLPIGSLSDLRIGFDLMGAGDVLIDRVRIYDAWMDEKDATAMTQNFASAVPMLTSDRTLESCRRLVEGYWSRFLDETTQGESPVPLGSNSKANANTNVRTNANGSLDGSQPPVAVTANRNNNVANNQPRQQDAAETEGASPTDASSGEPTSLLRRWRDSLRRRQ